MRFDYAGPGDPRGMYHERWVSENGIWELGIYPVMFGWRVGVSRTDELVLPVDYCCGADHALLFQVLMTVKALMEPLPETISTLELERHFPRHEVKPIDRDPIWRELQRREVELQRSRRFMDVS